MPDFFQPAPMPVEDLREQIDYNPESGKFQWKIRKPGRAASGEPKGRLVRGYARIMISGKLYMAHRLAWYLFHGNWPPGDIDHKNSVRDDNRIINLRLATRSQNCMNTHNRCPISGFRCVYRDKKKWTAEIKKDGRKLRLGNFDTPEKAYEAVCIAIQSTRGDFARVD